MIDKTSYTVLKYIAKNQRVSTNMINDKMGWQTSKRQNPHIAFLLSNNFIRYVPLETQSDGEGGFIDTNMYYYEITVLGIAFLESQRKSTLNFWLPYAITTLIAIASLLVSIAALFPAGAC